MGVDAGWPVPPIPVHPAGTRAAAVLVPDAAVRRAALLLLAEAGIPAAGFATLDDVPPGAGDAFCCLVLQPGRDGLGVVGRCRAVLGHLPILLLVPGPAEAELAIAAIEAGVERMVEMPGGTDRLPEAVLAAAMPRAEGGPAGPQTNPLGEAEERLIRLLATGMTLREVGRRLGLGTAEVRALRERTLRAMGAADLAGAIRSAWEMGLRA